MKLDEIVAWYQKKIGTYDKQQWEKTVEQKILDGFSSVTLKTAKLKTEFIDVDLVRGSTFPKAKPKQSLLTVIRLAIQRYFLLPLYARWWVKQTSHNAFALLLTLYLMQMLSWAIYTYNTNRGLENVELANVAQANATNNSSTNANAVDEHIVFISDLLIPMALSLLLSLIHSQIVATNILTGSKKRRRFSNANISSGGVLGSSINNKLNREPRLRRRKKFVKVRNLDISDINSAQQQRKTIASQPIKKRSSIENELTATKNQQDSNNHFTSLPNKSISNCQIQSASLLPPNRLMTLDLNNPLSSADVDKLTPALVSTSFDCLVNNTNTNNYNANFKKRNVNWHSPVHNFAVETQEKQQQTSPQTNSTTTSSSGTSTPNDNANKTAATNSTSSSGNNSLATPTKTVRIDDCVKEFYDELVTLADEIVLPPASPSTLATSSTAAGLPHVDGAHRRAIGEDDGFESLNGKSSSGEETNASLLPTTSSTLRLRLNATRADELTSTTANTLYSHKVPSSAESNANTKAHCSISGETVIQQQNPKKMRPVEDDTTDGHTDEDVDDVETISSPASAGGNNSNYIECTTSATEWLGVTTNSEDCSYSSELENSDDYSKNQQYSDEDGLEMDFVPATILNPHSSSDRISCTIWEQRDIKKAQMSVLEISSCIIERVESMPETNDYIFLGIVFSLILTFVPTFCRLCEVTIDTDKNELSYWDLPMLLWEKSSFSFFTLFHFAFGQTKWERTVLIMSLIQRFCLTSILFIIFAVAERTFKQRFLYAKLFSHLTSSRRARKSNLPHFRLNKVRNIKTWLSVRSYLKKRGPQRSVDVIVSGAFIITHLLLAFLSVEWLKDSVHLHSHLNLEALMWSSTVGIFLLRFMTLGNKIHHKYRSISVLITEQINLYLQIEQKPKKKDELMVSNSVLKLAADLLKELESPFKVSGLRANPYLFTTIKVVILSALSGVLSEMLGFKLKLLKIKIK